MLLSAASVLALALSAGGGWAQTVVIDGETVTVPGDRTNPWNMTVLNISNSGELIVKNGGAVSIGQNISVESGSGVMIEAGGNLSSVRAYLGNSVNSEGTVTVTGANASWSSSRDLFVGYAGIGNLTIENGGTVKNSNSNAGSNPDGYRASVGDSVGSEGTVNVTGLGSTWINSRRLFVGNAGSGTLTISDSGVVQVGSGYALTIANAASAKGTVNIGAAATAGPAAPGEIENTTVNFGDGEGTLNFNHTGADYVFGSSLASTGGGAHTINHLAGTTVLTGDSSGFTGTTTVSGGTLVVNNALGGSVVVSDGGRLAGDGTIGSGNGSVVTIGSGGTIAPGNSIGTMTVVGDFVFDAGSTYEVEVAPGGTDSDLIEVTGTATLNGGSVVHIGMTGDYTPTATYTILTADDGLNGRFSGVESEFAFLDPILGYGANAVTLTLQRNDIDFTDVATTRNQFATAGGLETLTFGNALYDAVVQTDEAMARAAFDQLSGELHASVKSGLIDASRHIRNAANDRLRTGLGANDNHRGIAAWGTVFGSWGHSDSAGNAARLDRSTAGFVAGLDGRIANAGRVGFLAGYSRSSFDVDDRRSSADADSYHLGLYGGTEWGALALRGGLAYTWHDLETSRSVAFTGFADKLAADYGAGTFQAFGEVGYRIHTGMISLEPFANLAYVDLRTDGFTERGGAAALTSAGQSTDVTFSVVGLRAEMDLAFGATKATLRGMAGWQHAFGDTAPLSTHAFAGSDTFTIAGAPIAEDLAVVEAGLDLDLAPEATLGVRYQGRFGADAKDNGFNARLSVRF